MAAALLPPKGTRDFLPQELEFMDSLLERISESIESFGYLRIETPAFEYFEILAKKSGEEVEKQLYAFEDKGGRKLALRFDGTVPIARIIASNPGMPKPIRLFYSGKFWRYEDTQAGRFREFYQAGIELVGPGSRIADAEAVACLAKCLTDCGLEQGTDFSILINTRKVLSGFASSLGISDTAARMEFFRTLDKKDKMSRKDLEAVLKDKLNLSEGEIGSVREFLSLAGSPEKVLTDARLTLNPNKEITDGLDELESFTKYLDEFGILDCCMIDLGMARGLDYYTGLIFEVRCTGTDNRPGLSIAGGGRYDELIGAYGSENLPATGWAIGIDRLIDALKEKNKTSFLKKPKPSALVVPLDIKLERIGIRVSGMIRDAGVNCQIDVMARTLKNCIEFADKNGIDYVVIIGEREAATESVTVKDMKARSERNLKQDELGHYFKSRI